MLGILRRLRPELSPSDRIVLLSFAASPVSGSLFPCDEVGEARGWSPAPPGPVAPPADDEPVVLMDRDLESESTEEAPGVDRESDLIVVSS